MALGFDLLLIARRSLICVLPDRQDFMLYGIYLAKSLVLGVGWVGGGEVEPGLFGTPPPSVPRPRQSSVSEITRAVGQVISRVKHRRRAQGG